MEMYKHLESGEEDDEMDKGDDYEMEAEEDDEDRYSPSYFLKTASSKPRAGFKPYGKPSLAKARKFVPKNLEDQANNNNINNNKKRKRSPKSPDAEAPPPGTQPFFDDENAQSPSVIEPSTSTSAGRVHKPPDIDRSMPSDLFKEL